MEDLGDLSLIAALKHRAAAEPDRPWASIPKDNNDLSKGFKDFSFKQLVNAVENAANWLRVVLDLDQQQRLDTIAYLGASDLTPAVLALAAARTGVQLFLPFSLAPLTIKRHLIKAAGCKAILCPDGFAKPIEELVQQDSGIKRIVMPGLNDWFTESTASQRSANEIATDINRPWLIFHTSGTTGIPKIVRYTQKMMTYRVLEALDKGTTAKNRKSHVSLFWNSRVHISIPFVHLGGLVGILVVPILEGSHMVLGPLDRPPSGETIVEVIKYGQIEGLVTPPVWLRQLSSNGDGLASLRKLKYISWGGAGLDNSTGDALCHYTLLSSSIATTECGLYMTWVPEDPQDWAYCSFIEGQGIEFEEAGDGLHELVIRKLPNAAWQQIFELYPGIDVYRTSDLFRQHSNKSDLWLYSGRKDDMFKLNNGWPIYYASREQSIEENQCIKTAVVGGPGQTVAFLLIEMVNPSSEHDLASIQQTVSEENLKHTETVAIHEDMIIVADPARPFKRSAKDTILRKETFDLYRPDIEERLSARGHSWNDVV